MAFPGAKGYQPHVRAAVIPGGREIRTPGGRFDSPVNPGGFDFGRRADGGAETWGNVAPVIGRPAASAAGSSEDQAAGRQDNQQDQADCGAAAAFRVRKIVDSYRYGRRWVVVFLRHLPSLPRPPRAFACHPSPGGCFGGGGRARRNSRLRATKSATNQTKPAKTKNKTTP